MIKFTIDGRPYTKKNSQRILTNRKTGRPFIAPSEQYKQYEKECGWVIPSKAQIGINKPCNLKAVYYMPTRHKVDLCNLLEATCDILVKYGVLEDDNSDIVYSHDGSHVEYCKEWPRVEIEIEVIE